MIRVFVGIFLILHGLVHLLYAGQSRRVFELSPGLVWPDGAWASARLLGNDTTRLVVSVLLALAALGFLAGGLGLAARLNWWRPVVISAAIASSAIFLLFWDGKLQALAEKGGVGLLINLALLILVLILQWPA